MLLFKINDSYCEYDIGTKQNYCQLLNEKQGALNQALGMTEWPRHPKYKFYLVIILPHLKCSRVEVPRTVGNY